MSDCIFCKILAGEIPSQKVYEDELCYAFEDIQPQTRIHVLLIPKKHIASVQEAKPEDQALLGHMLLTVDKIAHIMGVDQSGYRVITNVGEHGCQTVLHMHFHMLGGEQLHTYLGGKSMDGN